MFAHHPIFSGPITSRSLLAVLLSLLASGWIHIGGSSAVRADDLARDYIVVVLDASGSMAGRLGSTTALDRMTAAKLALIKVSQQLSTNTHIGLLVFGDPRLPDDWVYPLARLDRARLRAAIQMPKPGAGTPLGAYLKKGADRLLEARAQEHGYGTYRLLVVTDGEAQDPDLVERYTPEIIRKGLTLDLISVAMAQRHTLARLAHSHRAANDPEAMNRALAEVFAEIGGQPGRQAVTLADFDLLKSIPTPVAAAALEALSQVENSPIGGSNTANQRPTESPAPNRP